jgi:hypothetical protein
MADINEQFGMLVTRQALEDFVETYGEEGAANELAMGFRNAILEAISELKKENNNG